MKPTVPPEPRSPTLDPVTIEACAEEVMRTFRAHDNPLDERKAIATRIRALATPPGQAAPTSELPPELLAVLRDPSIPLESDEETTNFLLSRGLGVVIGRGCKKCMAREFPYWHPADRACPTSGDTPAAATPPRADEAMSAPYDYDPKAADRYHAYRQGWRDGAAGRWKAKPFMEHATRPDMVAAYVAGYEDGEYVASKALLRAQRKYKFTPSILRDGAVAAAEGAPGQTKP